MPDRSGRRDTQTLAFDIVQQDTGEKPPAKEKDPAADALGRKAWLKGGRAGALALSPMERSEIES